MVLIHQATYSHDNRTQITHTPCITQLNTHIMRQSIIVNYDGTLTRQTTHGDPLTRKKGLRLGWLFLMLSSTSGGVSREMRLPSKIEKDRVCFGKLGIIKYQYIISIRIQKGLMLGQANERVMGGPKGNG